MDVDIGIAVSADEGHGGSLFRKLIEFLLSALLTALREVGSLQPGEQVDEQLSEQVARILKTCSQGPRTKAQILESAGLANAYLNYKRHILPLIQSGLLEMTIPDKPNSRLQNHQSLTLATGQPHSPLWKSIGQRVSSAVEVDLLASFIQPSGLDLIQLSIFSALRAGARIRILVGDYLYITSAEALRRLVGWMALADEILENSSLEVRLAEISKLPSKPDSFHPKAWRIVDSSGGLLVVGSSNLSKAALETGVEWNLIGQTTGSEPIDLALAHAFTDLWQQATSLDDALVSSYALHAKEAHRKFIPPESVDLPAILYLPRPWQIGALESLDKIRADAYRRALVAVATGLGKTWLAAFDVLAAGKLLNRQPRVLIIAHRAEILIQAEAIRIDDPWKRAFFENECLLANWSVRQLRRQIGSLLYERTGLSTNKKAVIQKARKQERQQDFTDLIRDPYQEKTPIDWKGLGMSD